MTTIIQDTFSIIVDVANAELKKADGAKTICRRVWSDDDYRNNEFTKFLQDKVRNNYRSDIDKDSDHVLWSGYKLWENTAYHKEYLGVNALQSACQYQVKKGYADAQGVTMPNKPKKSTKVVKAQTTNEDKELIKRMEVQSANDVKKVKDITDQFKAAQAGVIKAKGETKRLQDEIDALKATIKEKDSTIAKLEIENTAGHKLLNTIKDKVTDLKVTRKALVAMFG